ncbi:kinesin-like protein KIN-14I [Humulus lupulus]|uniref:kinesin-like protein KIN-14I n=1 Tax=Humulus lupulus TaxID=3486 RepID=UPI002B40CF19|nr:kinesin-like protein KIN-14I [Humulus lupulus]
MATEQVLPFSVASIVEDVLHQHGARTTPIDFASRKAEEASLRRNEAAGWLRRTIGVVGGKDLPAEPSEEDFRLGLRSGIILCNVLNKVNPGSVTKVVEGPSDSVIIPDGAALSAYQYFENVRNFLVAVEEMGLPTFEASDLEQGGMSARVVNCVLALKSFSEWKQAGGIGSWKFGGNMKPPAFGKPFMRKNSEPYVNSFLRTLSCGEKSVDSLSSNQSSNGDIGHDLNETGISRSLNVLVREVLSDKRHEEIPLIIESMLGKVVEEFERRLASQSEFTKSIQKDIALSGTDKSLPDPASDDIEMEAKDASPTKEEAHTQMYNHEEAPDSLFLKQHMLLEKQQRDIQDLKLTLHHTKAGMQFLQMKHKEEFENLGKHLRSLAYAASGYQRVLEENRKLYNQVQDLRGNIRVYCRVRPFFPGESSRLSTVDHIDDGNITVLTPAKYCKEGRKSFTFNKVFGPCATQEEVFSDTRPLIRSVLDGYNVCIFAYGQTGSGKTFTMTGPKELTEESQGVNYRALHDLFLLSEQRKDTFFYEISVQMLEIYNEQVRDLLITDGVNKRLEIRNSSQNGINVPDANLVPVSTTPDVLYLMNLGHKNRAVSATAMNDRSSRSHSCLTVHVQGRDLTSGAVLRGCMHLVDLAGSERVDKSEVTGDRLKEAQHINKSLSALGDVISSLAQKNSHVPYRNSKLTQLLQDSLGGQAKTLMFVHISPEAEAVGETISTLKFAERVSTVELGAAKANKDSTDVKELKDQIANLKAALVRKEGERERRPHSRSSSPDRFRLKSAGSSPSHPSWKSLKEFSGGRRQPVEDVGNVENSASKLKRRSLDLQDVLMHSSSWPSVESSPDANGKEDDKESVSSDWVDKIMVNKQDIMNREENLVECWDVDSSQLTEMFGHNYLPDPSKIYPEQQLNSKINGSKKESQNYDLQRSNRYEMATTDDSDDQLEAAISDSSEPDMLWQLNPSKATSIPNGLGGPETRKTNPKPVRSTETRSMIPSLIPSPSLSRKAPNGPSQLIQPSYRPVKQAVHGQGKRRTTK